jgi:sec-independent protein translocase protein TatC
MNNEKILPFLEHLTELRKRLIIIIIGVVIGMGIAWNLSDRILVFIEKPLTGDTYLSELKTRAYQEMKKRYPAIYNRYNLEKEKPAPVKTHSLYYNAPLEPFFIQCKISLIAGFILALPLVFYQVWLFVAPGLTTGERRLVVPFVTTATIAFCIGGLFFLNVIWPVIINFSNSYEREGLQSLLTLSYYVNFCLRLIIIFGLIFELPVLTLLLSRFGLVSGRLLARYRKYAVLASAIIAAFHADMITMFVVMVPMYLMYEVSIWTAYLFGKRKKVAVEGQAQQ